MLIVNRWGLFAIPGSPERRQQITGAGLRSLAEPWADTTSPAGRMVLTAFAGIADFERALIAERTGAGRIAARARGVRFGPSPSLSAEQIAHARPRDRGRTFGTGREVADRGQRP